MSYETVTTAEHLADLCGRLTKARRIGFDTEFVSEDTFRPELCLVQVVSDDALAVIDPQQTGDLSQFWRTLAEGRHDTIVHAAREEINFSLTDVGAAPANLFDTQLAAAFCGPEYPASYGTVVTRFLGERPDKGEQRTDWRKRPLTDAQINYALEDVRFLLPLHDKLSAQLDQQGRRSWFDDEMQSFVVEVTAARTRKKWRKVSGIGSLPPRSLAIVRELWNWRQEQAEQRDSPPRRVLRDDLIVELAKRKSNKPDKIRAIRGMNYRGIDKMLPEIAECISRGLDASLDDISKKTRKPMPSQLTLLGQFLTPAITSICRSENVAASLVGGASDVRDLIAYRLEFGRADSEPPPSLAVGWRADLVGHLIEELLAGKRCIRIADPHSADPLDFNTSIETQDA